MIKYWIHNFDEGKMVEVDSLDISKPVLAFDFDGVFTKPELAKIKAINSLGYTLNESQAEKSIALKEMALQKSSLNEDEVKQDYLSAVCNLYSKQMDLVDSNDVLFGMFSDLKSKFDYSLIIVTSRNSSDDSPEVQAIGPWLSSRGETIDGVINTSNTSKRDVLNNLSPLIFVDDSARKLYELYYNDDCSQLPEGLVNTEMVLFYNQGNRETSPKGLITSVDGVDGLKNKLYSLLTK